MWLFAALAVSGVWIGTLGVMPGAWVAAAIAAIGCEVARLRGDEAVPRRNPATPQPRNLLLAAFASLPTFIYLTSTWSQDFPYNGDQAHHNGYALEAFAFWWPWRWLLIVAAIAIVARYRHTRLPLIATLLLPVVGMACGGPFAFAGRYPGTLHFFAAPFHALPFIPPLDVERTLNALAIPVWLLVLRPLVVRRDATPGTWLIAALLFWQKDVVYYFASGYLEPWAIVLVLTALEHLVTYDGEELWLPLLLLGSAAMVKEHVILALPIVALLYFPRQWPAALTAITPFFLFFRLRGTFKPWGGTRPTLDALSAAHFATYGHRVALQFGAALPIVILGVIALVAFARRRAFAALLLIALADFVFFFTATVQQPWTGYPRTNLVPLVCVAIVLGALAERLPRALAYALVALTLACNAVTLAPAMREAFGPDTARNFVEHDDAPIFYPIRAALDRGARDGIIHPGDEVHVLYNGKRVFGLLYPGPIEDQYPDLAARYRLKVMSFRDDVSRCRCSAGAANLAVFIAFHHLGEQMPQRPAIESEAQRCRDAMTASCQRVVAIGEATIGR